MKVACPMFSNLLALVLLATALSSTVGAQSFHYRIWNDGGTPVCATDKDCLLAVAKATFAFRYAENHYDENTQKSFWSTGNCNEGNAVTVICPNSVVVKDDYQYELFYCCDGNDSSVEGSAETPELAAIAAANKLYEEENVGEDECPMCFFIIKGILDGNGTAPTGCNCDDSFSYSVPCPTPRCVSAAAQSSCYPASCNKSCTPQLCCKSRCSRRGGFLRRLFRR